MPTMKCNSVVMLPTEQFDIQVLKAVNGKTAATMNIKVNEHGHILITTITDGVTKITYLDN